MQGVQIFGTTGSGKSSGSGAFLAKSYLTAGFGGLILTVKIDEKEHWQKYCQETGRELEIFNLENPWRFNFLDYEMNRVRGGGQTENLVDLFFSILELESNERDNKGERYWDNSLKQLLRNTIDLIRLSGQKMSMSSLYQVITSAPQNLSDTKENSSWEQTSFCAKLLLQTMENFENLKEMDKADFDLTQTYWLTEYPNLAEKTRSIIVSSFTGMADIFLRGSLREMFCTTTTFYPEFTHEGMLLLVDLPVKVHHKLGQYAQAVLKYCWQKATENREPERDLRPTFLWADEAQFFINSHDVSFQSTARSSRACTVYLTQTLPSYTDNIGLMTKSLLANLQTKIFHRNDENDTNKYVMEMIGKDWQKRKTSNYNSGQNNLNRLYESENQTDKSSYGVSTTEVLEYEFLPIEFSKLAKGSWEYENVVEGLVYQGGRIWQANGKSFLKVTFWQE